MMVTCLGSKGTGSSTGSGIGFGSGSKKIDERIHELIATEVTHGILDATPVIFGTVKEGI